MLAQSIASCPDFRSDQSSRPRGNGTRSLKSALIAALKAAGASRDLGEVRRIHGVAIQRGLLQSDVFVANSVISMYAKCGSMEEAREVFQGMEFRDVVSWNALIGGYAEAGGPGSEIALGYFEQFQRENGCSSSSRTFVAAVKACAGLAVREEATLLDGRVLVKKRSLELGMALHSQAAKDGFERDLYVSSSLVDMYAKCGSLLDARRIFERMPERNAVSWTALISGYAESGDGETALEIFERFFRSFPVDGRALVAAIKACGCVAVKEKASLVAGQVVKMVSLERGMAIHSLAGSETDIFVASSLVDMYAKCGRMEEARRVFDGIPGRDHDVVLWTSLIQGYAENDEFDLAFEIFASGVGFHGANSQTLVAVLKACSGLASIEQLTQVEGKFVKIKSLERSMSVHSEASKCFSDMDVHVASSLIDLYAKCGSMEDSQAVFDRTSRLNVVCWNALILGYAENGDDTMALGWFEQFMQCCGGVADSWTFVGVIRACSSLASKERVDSSTGTKIVSLEKGMAVHSHARSLCCQSSIYVASSVIDMYAKCGSMVDARRVFDKAPSATRDVVLWTTLVLGYAENGDGEAALEIFQRMKSEGCHLDVRVFAAALKACAVCSDLRSGEAVYEETCRHGIGQDPVVVSCLVDLYGKCGSVAGAQRTFDCSGPCGTVTWNALIAAYAQQGDSGKVFETFSKMLDEAAAREQGESNGAGLYLKPDSLTLVSVLTACSHAGLADKGKHILEAMPGKFGIQPSIEHYHCLVDLLGRANRVDEALAMVEAMPFEASAVTWTTVLGSCKSVEDIEVAKVAFDSLVSLNDRKSSAYVLMAEALNK